MNWPFLWPTLPLPPGAVSDAPHLPADETPTALHPIRQWSLPPQPFFFFFFFSFFGFGFSSSSPCSSCLQFTSLLDFLCNYYLNCWGPFQCLGPMVSSSGPPSQSSDLLFACHTVRVLTPLSLFLWVQLQGRRSHLNTPTLSLSNTHSSAHALTHTHTPSHPGQGEKYDGTGSVSAYTEECLPPNERGEDPTQHLSCHSDLCHWVDSSSKNRSEPPSTIRTTTVPAPAASALPVSAQNLQMSHVSVDLLRTEM